MKLFRLSTILMIVWVGLTAGLVFAQDDPAAEEPVSDFAPPTDALMPCPVEVTEATVCDASGRYGRGLVCLL